MKGSRVPSFVTTHLRKPAWGAVMFSLSLIGSIASFFLTTGIAQVVSIIVGLLILAGIIIVNRYFDEVKLYFVQTKPTTSAETHYNERYPVSDGYAEFDVFLDISSWVEDFRIKINANGPFNINIWEGPAPIKLDDDIISCTENIDEISFTLQFAADSDDLGDGSYLISFENFDNGRTINSFKLNANPKLNTDHELSDLPSEARDELELDGEATSSTS